jgi:hypothetical protein
MPALSFHGYLRLIRRSTGDAEAALRTVCNANRLNLCLNLRRQRPRGQRVVLYGNSPMECTRAHENDFTAWLLIVMVFGSVFTDTMLLQFTLRRYM